MLIEGLEHWCNSPMSDYALCFFSFTSKYLIIRPHSIFKSRLILVCAALDSQLNNQPLSLILPEKMLRMPWEISWHPPWTWKESYFCFLPLVQPRFSWMHIQNKGACYLRLLHLPLWFVALLQFRFAVCSCSLQSFNLSSHSSVLLRALMALWTAWFEQRNRVWGFLESSVTVLVMKVDSTDRIEGKLSWTELSSSFLLECIIYFVFQVQRFKVDGLRMDQGFFISIFSL